MNNYRLKSHNIQAVKYTGNNWHEIEKFLGPHLVRTKDIGVMEEEIAHYVFNIADKDWKQVWPNTYVIRDDLGVVTGMTVEYFESTYELIPATYNTYPGIFDQHPRTQPYTWEVTSRGIK